MHTETCQTSNLESEDVSKEILSTAEKWNEKIFPAVFQLLKLFINNGKGWKVKKTG